MCAAVSTTPCRTTAGIVRPTGPATPICSMSYRDQAVDFPSLCCQCRVDIEECKVLKRQRGARVLV
jgi:hypothetical protein